MPKEAVSLERLVTIYIGIINSEDKNQLQSGEIPRAFLCSVPHNNRVDMNNHIFYIIYFFLIIFSTFSYLMSFVYVDARIYTYTYIDETLWYRVGGFSYRLCFSIGFIDDDVFYIIYFISMYGDIYQLLETVYKYFDTDLYYNYRNNKAG